MPTRGNSRDRIVRLGGFALVLGAVGLAPGVVMAGAPLGIALEGDALVWDLTGSAFGRDGSGRLGPLKGLRLDAVDIVVPMTSGWGWAARLEGAVSEDPAERDLVMGAFELGLRYQPRLERRLRPFLSAGLGWVGGGVADPQPATPIEHELDPQLHVQAGMDVRLGGGSELMVRVPVRYLWGIDRPLAAATVSFRHSM